MAFTLQTEIDVVNQACDRLAIKNITLTGYSSDHVGQVANRHYFQTRNSLFRSYNWPFATTQTQLYQVKTLTLGGSPTTAFSVDDIITGIASGTTAKIYSVTSSGIYVVTAQDGDFTLGETISSDTISQVYYDGSEIVYGSDSVVYFNGTNQIVCSSVYPTSVALAPNHQYLYQYELPSDFERLVSVYELDFDDWEDERLARKGNRLLTNYATMNIEYVQTLTDPSDWDSLFTEFFILTLAVKMQPVAAGAMSSAKREELKKELADARSQVRVTCSQENNFTGRNNINLARY